MDHPINQDLFEDGKIDIENGYIKKPNTYGLGVHFDEKIISQFPYKEKINTMISTEENDIKLVWVMNIKFIDTPKPIGNFANVRFSGKYAYISGQGAFDDSGNLIIGKVGKDLNLDEGYEAARRVGITILSVINNDKTNK